MFQHISKYRVFQSAYSRLLNNCLGEVMYRSGDRTAPAGYSGTVSVNEYDYIMIPVCIYIHIYRVREIEIIHIYR